MKNKEKKKHHFVPQVYLSKFAHTTEKKGKKNRDFVSTYDKIENREEIKNDVKNICFKTKLYTVNSSKREERESIENFYANTIEKDYNKFYDLITDDNKVCISPQERELIILTIINLYLRNLYWFKVFNDFWTNLIKSHKHSNPVNIYSENGEILFPFETQNMNEIIATHKKENKQAFIQKHLKLTINLVKSHFSDIIFVDTNKSDTGFITSDRPVICTNISGSFRLPINKDYLLIIMPNTENVDYNPNIIIRNNPFINSRTRNLMQYENAERYIIGFDLKDILLSKNDYLKATKC